MNKNRSLFFPLALIATGVVWLLVNMKVIPAANLWALTHIWPYVLIALGAGLILRSYWPAVGWVVSALVVIGAVLAVVYAPQLGWARVPSWSFGPDFGGGVTGSGEVEAETRDVQDFLAVSVNYPAQVVVQQGESESVKIEAEDNLLPQLATEMRNGTLYIENSERDWSQRVNPTKPVKITIIVKDVREISFSTAGTLRVENLETDSLKLILSGAGDVTLTGINVRELDCTLSGAGNIYADGVADKMSLSIDGFGSIYADELFSMEADVEINGAGSADVSVKNDLSVVINGAGSVNYHGSPNVRQRINGAGSVKQVGK